MLPDIFLITPDPSESGDPARFLQHLHHALTDGIRLVQLRVKRPVSAPAAGVDAGLLSTLIREARQLCEAHGALLVLNVDAGAGLPADVDVDAVHLTSTRLLAAARRPDCRFVSAACHNLAELRHAERMGVDCVTLSPVLPTLTHPGEAALGWPAFHALASAVAVPVFALGGMTRQELAQAQACGAHGIAAIRSLWPAAVADGVPRPGTA